jgi:antibiotic biosynthesis monooxygenase (ABM) superfamily enzyme
VAERHEEELFVSLNERIRTLATTYGGFDDAEIPFVCECAATECFAPVVLSLDSYDDLRASGGRVLVPGHEARVAAATTAR